MKYLIYAVIRFYQWVISPVIHTICGPSAGCRFIPTCSHYFLEAVMTHGAIRGSGLGLKRICRCRPRGGFGHDPVPPKAEKVRAGEKSTASGENSGGQCERSALYDSPPHELKFSTPSHQPLNHNYHG